VKKLEAVFRKVMDTDRFKKYLEETMIQPGWVPSQEYSKLLDRLSDDGS